MIPLKKYITFMENIMKNDAISVSENNLKDKRKFINHILKKGVENTINKIDSRLNFKIPPEHYNYPLISFLKLSWHKYNDPILYGGFDFNGMDEAFTYPMQNTDFEYEIRANSEYKSFQALNDSMWFNKQKANSDEEFSVLARNNDEYPWDIYYLSSGTILRMQISFSQFFDALLESMGIFGWQLFYVKPAEIIKNTKDQTTEKWNFIYRSQFSPNTPRIKAILKHMEICCEWLPKLFPDKDFSYHYSQLEKLKRLS